MLVTDTLELYKWSQYMTIKQSTNWLFKKMAGIKQQCSKIFGSSMYKYQERKLKFSSIRSYSLLDLKSKCYRNKMSFLANFSIFVGGCIYVYNHGKSKREILHIKWKSKLENKL